MTPIPVDPGPDFGQSVVFAANQPAYLPLVARFEAATGTMHFKLYFTSEERIAIEAGQDLMFDVMTFGQPLQPMNWYVEKS